MAIGPKKRFEVLRRDGYRCRYCGRRQLTQLTDIELQKEMSAVPVTERQEIMLRHIGWKPDLELEVDHIIPRAGGGSDHISNLGTSCRDCNRGKGATTP